MREIKNLSINDKPLKLCKLGGGVKVYEAVMGRYEELTYIGTSGTQYIDTGVHLYTAQDFAWEMDVEFGDFRGYEELLGNSAGNTNYEVYIQDDRIVVKVGTRLEATYQFKNNRVVVRVVREGEHAELLLDGVKASESEMCYLIHDDSIYMLRCGPYFTELNLYGAKIEFNGEVVRDFRPVRRLEDGAVGLYDSVSESFFENLGTGAFIAGEPTGRYF